MQYKKQCCERCGQTLYTQSSVNKGTILLLSQILEYISLKGVNVFHPEKELVQKNWITPNMRNNLVHLSNNGLIAKYRESPGNWVVTTKALNFIKGHPIPKTAIIDKSTKKTIGYTDGFITYEDIKSNSDEFWFQNNVEIQNGNVITYVN